MYIIIAGSEGTGFTATNLEVFPKKRNFKLAIEWSSNYSIREGEGNIKKYARKISKCLYLSKKIA